MLLSVNFFLNLFCFWGTFYAAQLFNNKKNMSVIGVFKIEVCDFRLLYDESGWDIKSHFKCYRDESEHFGSEYASFKNFNIRR